MAVDKAGGGGGASRSSGPSGPSGPSRDSGPSRSSGPSKSTGPSGPSGSVDRSKTERSVPAEVTATKVDSFERTSPAEKTTGIEATPSPHPEAAPAPATETVRASDLVAAQPAVVPGQPVDPAAAPAAPSFAPRAGGIMTAAPTMPEPPVAEAAPPAPAPEMAGPALETHVAPELATPSPHPEAAPAALDPTVADPFAAPSPEIGLPGDAAASPHAGDAPLSMEADGTVTVRAGGTQSADVLGGQGTFEGEIAGVEFNGSISGGPFSGSTVVGTMGPVNPDGTRQVTMTYQREVGVQVEAGLEVNGTGVSYEAQEGFRGNVTFSVDMQPDALDAMARGEIPVPNPVDPTSLPVGSRLTMRAEEFSAVQAGLSRSGVGITSGWEHAEGRGISFERIDENRARITEGPFNRTTNSLGISVERNGITLGAGVERQTLVSAAESLEFDITTEAGRAAYADVLASGQFDPNAPGTGNYQSIRAITDQREISATLDVAGAFDFAVKAGDGASLIERTTPAGTDYTYTADWRGQPVEMNFSRGPNGVEFNDLTLPVGADAAFDLTTRGALRDAHRLAEANGQTIVDGQYSLSLDAQGVAALQDGFVSMHRQRAAGGNPYYSDELRTMAADPNITDQAWREAVAAAIPANGPSRNTPDFLPLEASMFNVTSPGQLAVDMSQRHMLGTTHEDLIGTITEIMANNPGLRGDPRIGIVPVTQ